MNRRPAPGLAGLLCLTILPGCAPADAPVFTSVCRDEAGGQVFFIEERIAEGHHTGLQVAKVDFLSDGAIARLLIFAAVPGGIDEGDSYASSDLVLSFSSNADQYLLIRKADILLATEGETGPIIEGFRFHHDNGDIIQVIDDSSSLPCVAGDADATAEAAPAKPTGDGGH